MIFPPLIKTELHIEVTDKCNLKCRYCYNYNIDCKRKEHSDNLQEEEILRIIKEAKELDCQKVTFTGGEAFLHPNLFNFIDFCQDSNISILTNGTLLNQEILRKIKKRPQVKELKVSLDGFRGHDLNRIGSSHKNIIDNIWLIKKNTGCLLTINTVLTSKNLSELLDLYDLLKKIRIDNWQIDLPFLAGRYIRNYKYLGHADFEGVVFKIKLLLEKYLEDNKPFRLAIFNIYRSQALADDYFAFSSNTHPCAYSGWRMLAIKSNGDITFCPSLNIPLVNIREYATLKEALMKARQDKFFSFKVKNIHECMDCRYLKICGSGCRADAFYWGNNLEGVDPICCSILPLVEKHIIPLFSAKEQKLYKRLIDSSKNTPTSYSRLIS